MTGARLISIGSAMCWATFWASLFAVFLPKAAYFGVVLGLGSLGMAILAAGWILKRREGEREGDDREGEGSLRLVDSQ
jgi:hypothetical protein